MKRGILLACLLAATAVSAAEKKPAHPKAKQPVKPAVSAEILADLRKSKQTLAAAVGACARPGSCDPTSANRDLVELLSEAREKFMAACVACASQQQCELEQQRILDGKQSRGGAPCQ